MTYIRVTGRFIAQVGALTGSDVIGNYNTHAVARVVVQRGIEFRTYEVPVITGNALKHWHSVYLADVYTALGGQAANEFCKKGVGMRGYTKDSTLANAKAANSEAEAIEDLCNDIHGFLVPRKQLKRDSLVKFSFGVPVLEESILEYVSRFSVTQNRVVPAIPGKKKSQESEKSQPEMMVFKQEYSSAPLYGFAVSMNLAYVMTPMYETVSNESGQFPIESEVKLRKKAAITALLYMFTGVGSKQARALPLMDVKELIIAVSDKPLPNLVHGSYPDYAVKSMEILKAYKFLMNDDKLKVVCYNVQLNDLQCKKANSLEEAFKEVMSFIEPQSTPPQTGSAETKGISK
ncbi:type I-A CRISPR-associated protein Cas7/Csa2 [Infirmifilum sp.]|uniref:type I-A CRISPR-associated protein Cas7/Csa2 n=1 Tax=Infirmifilum sp. TaxID=2856575 RepID=UPI003D0F5A0C